MNSYRFRPQTHLLEEMGLFCSEPWLPSIDATEGMVMFVMRRRWGLLLALLIILMAFGGCAPAESPPEDVPQEAPQEDAAPEPGGITYPLEITDDAGRTVVIPEEPQRVISFAPSNTEILFSLGVGDRVVAVDDFSTWPPDGLEDVPNIGGVVNPNYEVITDLEPDLVFSIGGTDEFVARLEELNIQAVVLQPADFDGIYDTILLTGDIMNVPDIAASVVADMRAEVERVASMVADIPESDRPTVFFEVWPDPLMTTGPDTFIGFLVRTAGGRLISEDVDGDWVEFSLETLVDRDPEVIVTTFEDTVDALDRGNRAGWGGIHAVETGEYHMVDVEIVTHPSPRIVDGLGALARILHPDVFE